MDGTMRNDKTLKVQSRKSKGALSTFSRSFGIRLLTLLLATIFEFLFSSFGFCQLSGHGSGLYGAGGGGSMVYPGAGVASSTGSAWGTSYSTSGSGNVCLTTSCAMTTPNLGTPSAVNLTNATGLTGAAFGSQTANYFLAGPNGSAGNATFRAIVAADVPTLNQNTTGNAATATALASTPSQCGANNWATGIAASGNANCAQPNYGNIAPSGNISLPVGATISSADTGTPTFTFAANKIQTNQTFVAPSFGSGTSSAGQLYLTANATGCTLVANSFNLCAPASSGTYGGTVPGTGPSAASYEVWGAPSSGMSTISWQAQGANGLPAAPTLPNSYAEDPNTPFVQNYALRQNAYWIINGGSNLSAIGLGTTMTGTGSFVGPASGLPTNVQISVANGSAVGWLGNNAIFRTGRTNGMRMTCLLYIGTSISNVRAACAFTNASLSTQLGSSAPAAIYAEIVFDPAGGINGGDSTHWNVCTGTSASNQSCASTGVTVAYGTAYKLELFEDVTNSRWSGFVNGGSQTNASTNNPASGTSLNIAAGAYGTGTVTGTFNFAFMQAFADWY
jgi:hypothetical protein